MRLLRFASILSALVIVAPLPAETSIRQIDFKNFAYSFQSKTNATDDLVRQLIEKFTDNDKKGIVVMDLEPATGQTSSLGAWVADQLSTSLAATGEEIEV